MKLTKTEALARYEEYLRANYAPARIGWKDYDTVEVLKLVDYLAYESGFRGWVESNVGTFSVAGLEPVVH